MVTDGAEQVRVKELGVTDAEGGVVFCVTDAVAVALQLSEEVAVTT